MSPLQLFSILGARWKIALFVLLLTVASAVGISLWLPKSYTANTAVVVDVRSPDPIAGLVFQGVMAASYIATQVDIMQSERVARRVVRTLRLAEQPATREAWIESTGGVGDIEAWVAGGLGPNLTIKPSRESSVINVSYRSQDPQAAAAIANAYVQAYIETNLDLRVDPAKRFSGFFDERAKQLRDALEASQARLSAYQKDKGIINNDERLDIESARLNELSSQLVTLQAISAESSSRTAAANSSADRMSEVLSNPTVAGLRSELTRQDVRLQELNSRLGENHPQVQEAKAHQAELQRRLQTEINRVSGSVSVNNNINRAREGEIRAALEAQRSKLLRLKGQRDELAVLQRDVESAQRNYDQVVARLNQTTLESQNTTTNLSVLTPAVPPTTPSSPRIVLNAILSLLVGSVLAVGAALLIEWLDRRVRTAEDVVLAFDVPMLGVMPRPDKGRRFLPGGSKSPMIPRRVLARLPHAPAGST